MTTMTARERVLKMFAGEEVDRPPCFSGMGNVTTEGLKSLNQKFAATHLDAKMMAAAATTTYKLFGFECAVAPFDLCIEAEAMGCEINVYAHSEDLLYPTIKKKLINNEAEMELSIPSNITTRGRVPLMVEAIKLMKKDIGGEAAVGSYVLGPFTLAGQVMELNDLLKLSFKKPDKIGKLLDQLTDVIIQVAGEYQKAGVDYITVREMGATSDVLSPRVFKSLILPYLQEDLQDDHRAERDPHLRQDERHRSLHGRERREGDQRGPEERPRRDAQEARPQGARLRELRPLQCAGGGNSGTRAPDGQEVHGRRRERGLARVRHLAHGAGREFQGDDGRSQKVQEVIPWQRKRRRKSYWQNCGVP